MTSIDFYFNADDRLGVACRLAGKALQRKQRVLIYAPQVEVAQRIDRLLWTAPAVSFVPHCYAQDPLASDTPVLIASGDALPVPAGAACEVLLNLSVDTPPFFERHQRVLEIVAQDEEQVLAGRARFKFYRERGYEIRNHDLARVTSSAKAGA